MKKKKKKLTRLVSWEIFCLVFPFKKVFACWTTTKIPHKLKSQPWSFGVDIVLKVGSKAKSEIGWNTYIEIFFWNELGMFWRDNNVSFIVWNHV